MKDLLKLYSIYSVSKTDGEKEICDWICNKLDKLDIGYVRDGNTLYHFSKDNEVLLSAHLDQVATNGKAFYFYKVDNNILAYNDKWQRTSLGADDKNGVWIILKLLEKGYKFDFIISECEEIGGDGIKKVEPYLNISDAAYCLVLDRRGNTDILNKGSGTTYCEALAFNLKNYLGGYTVTTGSVSDTQTICKYMESVNMSVAYFNPHLATEYTDFSRLEEILADVEEVVNGSFIHYPAQPSDYKTKNVYDYNKYYNSSYYRGDY